MLLILLLLTNFLYRCFSSFIPKASLSPLQSPSFDIANSFLFSRWKSQQFLSNYKFSNPLITRAPTSFILHSLTVSPSTSSTAAGTLLSSESSHHINSSWLLGSVEEISPKTAVAKLQFLVFTSQKIHDSIYKHKKEEKIKRQMNSIKSNISQFWEGIKIPCAPSDFEFVVYLIIQYSVMFQILWSRFA